MEVREREGTLIQLGMEENNYAGALGWRIGYMIKAKECYPCNGLGYHIETCIEADGTRNRVKISCACCDGSGEAK